MLKITFIIWLKISMIKINTPKLSITPNFKISLFFDSKFAYLYINKRSRGHIAVGFGKREMTGSNIILVNKKNNWNDIYIKDCYAYGRFPFDCKESSKFEIIEKDINNNKIEVLLKRLIIINEPLTNNFNVNKSNYFIYSYTDRETIEFHYGSSCKYGNFELYKNEVINPISEYITPIPKGILHGFGNLFIWIFLCDILIFVVRFFKTIKFYNVIHSFIFILICLYTFIVLFVLWNERIIKGRNYPPHFYASIFILIFTFLEFITGIFLQLKIHYDLGKYNIIISKINWRYIHGILGLLCWISVRVSSYYGTTYLFYLYNINIFFYILTVETFIFLLLFILASIYYLGNKKFVKIELCKAKTIELELKDIIYQSIDTEIDYINNNSYFKLKEMKLFDNKIIVFYKNRIYNIENIIHPGGNYIFKEMKFRDITRFLFGSYGLELNNSENWLHSNFAFNLLEKYYIGNLKLEYNFLVNNKNVNKYKLTDYIEYNFNWNIYYFKNENVKVSNHISKLSDISTYFNIKSNDGIWRNYTTILSATKYNIELNKKLLIYISGLINEKDCDFNFNSKEYDTNVIPFVIKTYKSKAGVSEYLSNLKIKKNVEVEIEGPFGEGLYLNKKFDEISIITGGTGILPVYDLIDLIFKKLCSQYLLTKNIILDIPEIQLGDWIKNIKITLISSFQSDKEFYGIPYLDMISKLQKIIGVKYIDINIRFSNTPSHDYSFELFYKRINHNFIIDKIKNKNNNIYVCGPPTLNNSAYNILKKNNYKRIYII